MLQTEYCDLVKKLMEPFTREMLKCIDGDDIDEIYLIGGSTKCCFVNCIMK